MDLVRFTFLGHFVYEIWKFTSIGYQSRFVYQVSIQEFSIAYTRHNKSITYLCWIFLMHSTISLCRIWKTDIRHTASSIVRYLLYQTNTLGVTTSFEVADAAFASPMLL